MSDKPTSTMFHQAQLSAHDLGGRYKPSAQSAPAVTGEALTPKVPMQPAHSPWRCDPTGLEAPLGFSVEDHMPVGEAFELSLSLQKARDELCAPHREPPTASAQQPTPLLNSQASLPADVSAAVGLSSQLEPTPPATSPKACGVLPSEVSASGVGSSLIRRRLLGD